MKNKNIAGILALFLGILGAHKFYLNKPWIGILYMMLWFTFIPFIISIIEGIIYFRYPNQLIFNEKYNPKYLNFDLNLNKKFNRLTGDRRLDSLLN